MTKTGTRNHATIIACLAVLLGSCASGTKISKVLDVAETADAPYKKVLVVSVFAQFDNRVYLEKELVNQLEARGIEAVRSTSMMDSRTPVNRQTFVDMVEKISADAVLVSHMESIDTSMKVKDMRPEATYSFYPTYYFNVWNVDLTEYVEPQSVAMGHEIVLATQVYSVKTREPVWAIQSRFKIQQNIDMKYDYALFPKEAKAIVDQMSRDRLLAGN